jgi:tripartite-type tricarboxylate transporter receptor subunit TctC
MTNRFLTIARRQVLQVLIGCGAVLATASQAFAQTYPEHPIRVVVPYSPGGSLDVVARVIANALTARLGTSVVVDNRTGANGMIGAQAVARSPADGYTLLFSYEGTLTIEPALGEKAPFDTLTDFAPIVNSVTATLIAAGSSKSPVKTYAELRERATKNHVTFGTSGTGSTPHLFGEQLRVKTGMNWSHVPYKGGAQATTDAIGGQIDVVLTAINTVLPYVQSGQLRALFVGGKARSPLLPDTPTLRELGLGELDVQSWYGFLAPAGTPRPIIERLNREINAVLQTPSVRATLEQQGVVPAGGTPEEFGDLIKSDIARWKAVIKAANIKLQ